MREERGKEVPREQKGRILDSHPCQCEKPIPPRFLQQFGISVAAIPLRVGNTQGGNRHKHGDAL